MKRNSTVANEPGTDESTDHREREADGRSSRDDADDERERYEKWRTDWRNV